MAETTKELLVTRTGKAYLHCFRLKS